MNIDSILKVVRGIVRLRGATDNTDIGNVDDRLKTYASIDPAVNEVTVDNEDGNPVPITPTIAAQEAALRLQAETRDLLKNILCELRVQTLHLEQITDENFTKK